MKSSDASEVEATSSREMSSRGIGLIAMIVVKQVIPFASSHPSIHGNLGFLDFRIIWFRIIQPVFINFDDFDQFSLYCRTTDTNIIQLCP
jgi:hypothetical protein